MDSTKIIELFIDDEYEDAGIEAISLVSRPAHDEPWMAFNSQLQKMEEEEEMNPYTIVEDDFCNHNPKLDELGEKYSTLIKEGWEVVRVEKMTPTMVYTMQQEKFSNPNADSQLDTEEIRVRYKYIGPRDDKNRQFCADMLQKNRVYTIEDIERLSNPEFGSYNIFLWRGSFNCRHAWVRLVYKKQGTIRNNANSTSGLITEDVVIGPDTRNNATKANPSPTEWKPGEPRTGQAFGKDEEMAGLEDACWEGYEAIGTKILDGKEVPNCVPIKMTEDDFAESISDYPESVKNAAARAVKYAEENGWGSCGTDVGKQRASQLAKGENISVDTVKRMYSYLSRHKADLQSSKSYDDGCGKLMYDSWGGEPALKWAETKLRQLEKQKMTFAYDEEKRILIGAAMVPNRMIHRYDQLGNLYYVFFSKKSIKKMADKFLRQKRTDETNIEHDGRKLGADKVYITESWVSEDPVYDKSKKYGFELPEGTWYVAMKVEDDKIWKMIKEKSLTGFSVEGLFAEKSIFSKEDKQINQIKSILKSINDE
ncbi:Phage-like element PBSX protein, XkdF [uncultured Caudovirales phage]|uniref:Phage-like element PBSX protein, XkdF n=1 Tax=uncultured Caudovirales phage TaxID=2100421 RepID=A0A6J5LWJ2_9CAUD|nr:Phage-like element PBSX protein, XkdF [uncultured Caudovirales phage]